MRSYTHCLCKYRKVILKVLQWCQVIEMQGSGLNEVLYFKMLQLVYRANISAPHQAHLLSIR